MSILGIGTQGNPNTMRCEGGDLPHIQYQLDDPGEYVDEHIMVIGSGDAGIENALGLAADPAQANTVSIMNRSAEFARAKQANVDLLMEAGSDGRVNILCETSPVKVDAGLPLHGDPRRRAEDQVRPDHRPHGLLAAAQVRRGMRHRVHQRGPRRLSDAVAAIRDDRARHLRDRRARRLSADQALHEPGL